MPFVMRWRWQNGMLPKSRFSTSPVPLSRYCRSPVCRQTSAQLKSAVAEQARVWSAPEERVTRGRAYREILKIARDEGAELIVMGVHGKVLSTDSSSARQRIM
jgi:hypothetical protein